MPIVRDIRLAVSCLREDAPRAAARVAWTFLAALALFGASCAAIWGAVNLLSRLRDEHAAIGLLLAALVWIASLWFIWRPYRACRPVLAAILSTLVCGVVPILAIVVADSLRLGGSVERGSAAISGTIGALVTLRAWSRYLRGLEGRTSRLARAARYRAALHSIGTVAVTIGLCVLADEFGRREEEILTTAVVFLGAAALLLVWIPIMARTHRMPLLDAHEELNVHCPACGYSLIGLRELRCPECGAEFVLDELIRAQDYDLKGPAASARPAAAAAER